MPTDHQSPMVDERVFEILVCGRCSRPLDGATGCLGTMEHRHPPTGGVALRVRPASLVDEWRQLASVRAWALEEIAEAATLEQVRAICANGPLRTAPGSEHEAEIFRLRAERDALKEENTALCMTLAGRDETIGALRAEVERLGMALRGCEFARDVARADAVNQREGVDEFYAQARSCGAALAASQAEAARLQDRIRELEAAAVSDAHAYALHVKAARVEGARQEREHVRPTLKACLDALAAGVDWCDGPMEAHDAARAEMRAAWNDLAAVLSEEGSRRCRRPGCECGGFAPALSEEARADV